MQSERRAISEPATGDLTSTAGKHTETPFAMGIREEGNCETVVAAVFQCHGNEQRSRVRYLANGDESADRANVSWPCGRDGREKVLIMMLDGDDTAVIKSDSCLHTTRSFEGAALERQGPT